MQDGLEISESEPMGQVKVLLSSCSLASSVANESARDVFERATRVLNLAAWLKQAWINAILKLRRAATQSCHGEIDIGLLICKNQRKRKVILQRATASV